MPEQDQMFRAVYVHRGERRFGEPKNRAGAIEDADRLAQRFHYVEVAIV